MRFCVRIAVWAMGSLLCLETAHAYNSEEHKLLVDMAVPQLRIDRSITLPAPTRIAVIPKADLLTSHQNAKDFAVGFTTNNPAHYDSFDTGIQDNCYWNGFRQLEVNRLIWIPAVADLRDTILIVATAVYATPAQSQYSIGQLAAIYGDYRRGTRCVNGDCFLTHANTQNLVFEQGSDPFYCPGGVSLPNYLAHIALGLNPPYGTVGNFISNTADNLTDYFEAGWWGDEMIRIANTNDWHFSNGAVAWYVGMHRLALHYVNLARTDNRYWNHALHCEANALHSLTDLFAFGHVVTNRDRTSHEIMKNDGLLGDVDYKWMQHVLGLGGGVRDPDSGFIRVGTSLPAIRDTSGQRDDFLESDIWSWFRYGAYEKYFHDAFNNGSGWVRNLNYDRFRIYGDGSYWKTNAATKAVIVEAVRASLQSLFDAYVELGRGRTVAEIGAVGSPFLAAIKSLPVYVESNPTYSYTYVDPINPLFEYEGVVGNNFTGRWTLYAKAIDVLAGTDIVPNGTNCIIQYVDGELYFEDLDTHSTPCDTFPAEPPPGPGPGGASFALGQNAPNPFDPSTTIAFNLPHSAHARLEILDMAGRRVATIVDEVRSAGPNSVAWDSTDDDGRRVGAGVYFYRLTFDGQVLTRKLVFVR